jgi:hypothetical protein
VRRFVVACQRQPVYQIGVRLRREKPAQESEWFGEIIEIEGRAPNRDIIGGAACPGGLFQ